MENVKADYWDTNNETEYLRFEDKNEAIEDYVNENEAVDGTVMVYGFKRQEVDSGKFANFILEKCYDYLSEDFDGEDGHEQNKEIKEAAMSFVKVYLNNYMPWQCDEIIKEEIDIKKWTEKELINE